MNIDWKNLVETRLKNAKRPDFARPFQMPRPPQSVAEFLRLVDQPSVPMSQLGSIIEKDTEIAAGVLKLVNGRHSTSNEKVISVARAIDILGGQRCKMLVMSVAIQSTMSESNVFSARSKELLNDARVRAHYARRVAELVNADGDVAYIAALLQDLTLPQSLNYQQDLHASFERQSKRHVEVEDKSSSSKHAICTAMVLKEWNFADEVVACIAMHHEHDKILEDPSLLNSEVGAVAISALLPGAFDQEPDGIKKLLKFQTRIPEFDMLQVATDVDEEMNCSRNGLRSQFPLSDRLSRLAVASIKTKKEETNWVERTVGSYTLEEKLGQGGMGVVYRARHSMLRRPAAVKMLKASELSAQVLEQFEIEAHITSELSSPHTVQVYDYGMTKEGELFYVMEFLEGMSLADIVNNHGPLPEERIIHILCQVCGSLAEAHSKGLIHRDIKPDNIALTVCAGAYDFAKVLDFGLVAVKDDIPELANSNKIFGTPAYMAPEAIQTPDLVNEATDVYALGAVAYFCLTGKPLFSEMSIMDVLRAQISQVPKVPIDNCSMNFVEIVMACLEKKMSSRPQSVMQLVQALSMCPSANSWTYQDAKRWWDFNSNRSPSETINQNELSTLIGKFIDNEVQRNIDSVPLNATQLVPSSSD